jgi:Fic family protein
MLFTADPLDRDELFVLKKIQKLEQELSFGAEPRRWYGLLRRNAFARAIRASNAIEGLNVTIDDAMAAVEQEEPLDPKTEAWLAVSGYRMAMTLVLQKATDPHFTYSDQFLNSLHFMMVGHNLKYKPGLWRTGSIYIHDSERDERVYEAPDADRVPDLMAELVETLEQENEDGTTPPHVSAAIAHLNLVMIHPFSDGNGRMGRCLQTLVLSRLTNTRNPPLISIEEYLGRNTRTYYHVLAEVGGGAWQPRRSTRPWIRFCLTAHFRQATTVKRRARYFRELFDRVESEVERRGMPERSGMAVAEAILGHKIRNATYRAAADVAPSLASKDLKSLSSAGLLEPRGNNRGRFYVASEAALQLASAIKKPARVEDPFEASRPTT